MSISKADSRSTHIFIIDIDLNEPGVSLEVGMPYDADVRNNFQRQTLTEMADYADRPWHRVAAMINADFGMSVQWISGGPFIAME